MPSSHTYDVRRGHTGNLIYLVDNLGDYAGANRPAALSNSESQLLVKRHRHDQLDVHLDVVARHNHLDAIRQLDLTSYVGRPDVELRLVSVEERSMPTALVLCSAHTPAPRTSGMGSNASGMPPRTWPRSTSSRSTPRSRTPTASPGSPSSSVLWNISTPVTTVLEVSP